MSTLANPQIRAACRDRVKKLDPGATPKWGRMTAPQMICHLNDSFRVGTGEKYASPATGLLQKTFVKWVALRTPLQWPQGVPTRPEVEQGRLGTRPGSWEQDRADLLAWIDSFSERDDFAPHPIFGRMSRQEWLIWGYRHVDHHLRQFGL